MKRGIAFILSLFLLSFVSAQFFDGYGYGSFSITNFLNSPDAVLLALFFLIAAAIAFVLRRSNIFRDNYGNHNRGIIAVISFSASLIAVWGIYQSGFDLVGLFSGLGFSGSLISILFIVAAVIAAFFMIKWFKISGVFMFFGLLIMFISLFTDLIYEKTTAFFIGLAILIIGIFFWKTARKWWGRNIRSY